MNRPMLILVGLIVLAGVVFFVIGNSALSDEAGPFYQYDTCDELFAAVDRHPSAPSGSYAARFRQLDCEP